MLKRLRAKFIIINMLLVFIVLLIVFGAIYITTYRQHESETRRSLERAISMEPDMPPPTLGAGRDRRPNQGEEPFLAIPVFSVLLDDVGAIMETYNENVSVSDGFVQEAVTLALDAGKGYGIIPSLDLRYMTRDTREGPRIAFADRSSELRSMLSLLLNSLIIGTGGLLAFFLISLYLSVWALKPVEKTWRQQQQFVADASHELKTPLTVILANMGILLSHKQATIEEQEKWVKNTESEALHMKKLVDDMLYLARTDAEKIPNARERISFSDVVLSACLHFESVAFEKGVALDARIDQELYVMGDKEGLRQLVSILLDNACKYAGENGTVNASLKKEQERLLLTVNNTGKGSLISSEDQERIFERFYRSDKSRVREQGGYGLGLAIAKSIAEAHGGRITVGSNDKEGTTFAVYLKTL